MLGDDLNQIGKFSHAKMAIEMTGLIEQSMRLGNGMASNPQRDVKEISVLIELLERLQRPLKALGWRGIRVANGRETAMLDESAARNFLQMINQKRIARLADTDTVANKSL